jgi:hypothetical protein
MAPDTKGVFGRIGSRVLVVVALLACSCASTTDQGEGAKASGPSETRTAIVQDHALQFDREVPTRPAGSQQEFVAAGYITGHLQQAGYRVRLDSVPVGDLVESSNVVALPPGDEDPEFAVVVPYGTGQGSPAQGEDIGLLLELARALAVKDPEHRTEFVALGAAFAPRGDLGSLRYLKVLHDDDQHPFVIALAVTERGGFAAEGARAADLEAVAERLGFDSGPLIDDSNYPGLFRSIEDYEAAGIDLAIASGGIEDVGAVLLEFLSSS